MVGYGTQKKESVVGAITQVNSQTLMQAGETSITNAITGKLSGVLTIQLDAEPGAENADLYVRGLSSWNGSKPLVLVDGVNDLHHKPTEINTISVRRMLRLRQCLPRVQTVLSLLQQNAASWEPHMSSRVHTVCRQLQENLIMLTHIPLCKCITSQ